MQRLSGIGVSPGIGAGRAVLIIQSPISCCFQFASRVRLKLPGWKMHARSRESWIASGSSPGRDLRAFFESQRPDLDDSDVVARAASSSRSSTSTVMGASAGLRFLAAVLDMRKIIHGGAEG